MTSRSAAFVDVVLRLLHRVTDVFEGADLVEVLDGEDALEDLLEADVAPLFGRGSLLQEFLVRALLDVDEIGNLDDLLDASEVLTESVGARRSGHALCALA
jgi:hypothetical protein